MAQAALKVARANAKRALTTEINYIRRCIAEDERENIVRGVDKVKSLFKDFINACDEYSKTFDNDDEIEACDAYFSEQNEKYIKLLHQCKAVMRDIEFENDESNNGKHGNESDAHLTSELLSVLNMPKVTLDEFNGDPLTFHAFMKSFDVNVDQVCKDPNLKLSRLMQYTNGPAKEAIRGCLLIGGEKGYNQAKSILDTRFGNPHMVMDRIVNNLRRGKPVKQPSEIQRLADDVQNAEIILNQLGMLNEINSQTCILDIVERLQPYLQISWKKKALEHKRTKLSYPDFAFLVKFLAMVASDVSDPVYGKLNVKKDHSGQSGPFQKPKSQSNFATSSDVAAVSGNIKQSVSTVPNGQIKNENAYARSESPCILCRERHRLWHCVKFKQMSPRQRLQLVEQNNLCHNCLMATHTAANCGKRSVCGVDGCNQKHTMYIHINPSGQSSNNSVTSAAACSGKKTYMPVVQVTVNDSLNVLALLDSGSTNSFCSRYLADKLGISGPACKYLLHTLNMSVSQNSQVVSLSLKSESGESLEMSGVCVIDSIPTNLSEIDRNLNHLKHLALPSYSETHRVDIVIGQDHAEALLPLDVRKGNAGEPFAVKTLLGWTVYGYSPANKINHKVVSNFISVLPNTIEDCVQKLWKIENGDVDKCGFSVEDQSVISLWESEYDKVDGHVELPIPWRNIEDKLPNNFQLARSRLQSLTKRLNRECLFERYDAEIVKLLEKNYAEIIPSNEIKSPERIWYLPHHAVCSDKKPDKLRIVYDCAAKYEGKSLNDRCKQGPNLVNNLTHVLLRFRENELAIQADIEGMYNQVKIPKKDRDALRFLWYVNGQITHFRMTSHLFGGIWCSSSSAYALSHTISDFQGIDSETKDNLTKSFYVDDYLHSPSSIADAMFDIDKLPQILLSGGFTLTKFVANDQNLLHSIPTQHRAKEVKNLSDMGEDISGCVLGINWHLNSDTFRFHVNVTFDDCVTRRKMLSVVSSIFDPLGLVGPFVLHGKLLFQEATRLKLSWDDIVPVNLVNEWRLWLKSLVELSQLNILRCIKPKTYDDALMELHTFADASQSAYGCCTYFRAINKNGNIHTQLIMSRNKVAPLKTCTVPRLELQAAVLAAKQDAMLRSQLNIPIDNSYFWLDSEIALKYIFNVTRRFLVFVSNRVSVIRQLTDPSQWHHISGNENPADFLTRAKLCDSDTLNWFEGPKFLKTYKETWVENVVSSDLASNDREVKRDCCKVDPNSCFSSYATNVLYDHPLTVISNHYSSWYRAKRGLALWIRFLNILKGNHFEANLTVKEISHAEENLIKHAQYQKYQSEIERLSLGKTILKCSSLKTLDPFLDCHGILRIGGRLSECQIGCQNPCIIPVNHPIASGIVRDAHCNAHLGVEWTLGVIRERYWIVKARPLIKRIVYSCVLCKKLYGKPLGQKMANLPFARLDSYKPLFTNVGIDFCGPFMVKLNRSEVKRYACIFTCLVSRAVHIEKVNSLDTDSFINAFRRFVSRRGLPEIVYSDNGTNLVAGEKELRKAILELSRVQIDAYAVKCGITWNFIPPHAPHMGGAWERMIGTIKRVMKGVLHGNVRLNDDILETVLCEIENIVNGRPLTKLSDNVNDPSPLTPNHLLLLRHGPVVPPGVFGRNDIYHKRWRHIQYLADQFWSKWTKLYLPELQKRVKWTDIERNLAVGDLVLIVDENMPRNLWPLGLVESVTKGRDGFVRSVCVRTRSSRLVRPVTKIVLLEASLKN